MNKALSSLVEVTKSADDQVTDAVANDISQCLEVVVDHNPDDVYLYFSSRAVLYDFARSLLHEAIYGESGQTEYHPLEYEGEMQLINGVRMSSNSARLFIFYNKD